MLFFRYIYHCDSTINNQYCLIMRCRGYVKMLTKACLSFNVNNYIPRAVISTDERWWQRVQGHKMKNIHMISPSCGTWDCLCEHSGRDTGDTGGFLSLCGWPCVSSSSSCVWWPVHTQDTGMVCHHPQESLEGTTCHCYYLQRTLGSFRR